MTEVGFVLAALIGIALGMLGGGGSILTVPVLVYVLGFDAKQAIAMSLVVVGVTSLVGSVGHWRAGNVRVRLALIFGAIAMAGTYLGARLAVFVSGTTQLALFAVVMLTTAVFMFRDQKPPVGIAAAGELPLAWIAIEGLAVGVITGLVGVGGGFLVVPALVLLGGLPMKDAVGTSLVVIAMKSAAGFLGYAGQVDVPWAFMTAFTAVAVMGIVAGAHLVQFVPQPALRRAFAILLLVVGSAILHQNRHVLVHAAAAQAAGIQAADRGHSDVGSSTTSKRERTL